MSKKEKKKSYTISLFDILLLLLIILAFVVGYLSNANASPCPKGQERIINVIDGDTFDIKEGRIRLLGVDAYDSMSLRMIEKQVERALYHCIFNCNNKIIQMGKNASEFAKSTLLGKCVVLTQDYKNKGVYGRLLRYVEIDGMDFGTLLLERGLANAYCGDKKIKRYQEYNELSEFKCKD